MATAVSLSIRSIQSIEIIESKLREMGVEMAPIPRSHRDRDILRSLQLEAIASALSQLDCASDRLQDQTKTELQAIADGYELVVSGTDVQGKITKPDLIQAIQAHEAK